MAVVFGLFVFLFLAVFQPFGLQGYRSDYKFLQLAGYGLITTITMLSSHLLFTILFPKWYARASWTVGKNILYALWVIFIIGTCNWVYSALLGFWGFQLRPFIIFQVFTLVIGVFPISISTLIAYIFHFRKALNQANDLNHNVNKYKKTEHDTRINIPSQNKSENLEVALGDLLFIQTLENYLEISTTHGKHLIRNTLKAVEQSLEKYPSLVRCHRRYLVNLQNVESFSGNAQGLSLKLKSLNDYEIPVSRNYVNTIKEVLD
ncbi:MAG: LytTR family transcriptional regulator [Cryomorphaceae bacterium]|nr:LytTR family transcriptional regulator [Cryomorphaceae bacterium]